ncbi:NAD-dependent epimerase/dehydratase family protein [Winogradskyella aurantia]|uniref:CDP-tyvelose epimerase n=1 Tax=Winogradskyella aurantia TaxID=1915063 RepID=A0A265UVA4_9FLAO|nr:NAD-dependent epimerase/dehydratase family protein [Winogradskyella aurantia]OZV69245.1 CDP-tyvelose epimerase [Winogradskyella aurantia]
MKIFITGICGFVGSRIAKHLKGENPDFEIFGLDNCSRAGSWTNLEPLKDLGITVYRGDIRVASDLETIPKADVLIDAAANPSVLAGVDGKTSSRQLIEHNLQGTINLLEYCKQHQAAFVLLSTSRVYSIPDLANLDMVESNKAFSPSTKQDFPVGISTKGVNESYSTLPPVSLYGSTKVASEHLALEYGETFGFPVWINRCGVLAGAGQFGHPAQGIFSFWIHSFQEHRPLKYIGFGGSGYQVRDCLHPNDLADLILLQLQEPKDSKKPRIINLSGGVENAMSLAQLTEWCRKHVGDNTVEQTKTERPFDIPWMVLDASKAKATWGWSPKIKIDDILNEIASFAKTQKNWCELSAL